jgi:hypothetical protein
MLLLYSFYSILELLAWFPACRLFTNNNFSKQNLTFRQKYISLLKHAHIWNPNKISTF